MSYYRLGPLLRERRVSLGYTQEELADGICAVNTLSRYENGERTPKKDHLEQLMQRLGLSDFIFDTYLDEKAFCLHELKYQIRQAVKEKHYEEAGLLLDEYAQQSDSNSKLSKQFLMLYRTRVSASLSNEEKLAAFEEAIKLTCPGYKRDALPKILSFEEVMLLNQIAGQLSLMNRLPEAIAILSHLDRYYGSSLVNQEEVIRMYPAVLYNLSKLLGLTGRYEECIEICSKGIRLAQITGRCSVLPGTLYNKAWAMSKRQAAGDIPAAIEAAEMAKNFAKGLGQSELLLYIDKLLSSISQL